MPHSCHSDASSASSNQAPYITTPTAHDRISDFDPSCLRQLAHLLFPYSEDDGMRQSSWERYQADEISKLPACLLQPPALDLNLDCPLPTSSAGYQASLCALHAPLNAFLIRKLYIDVIAECSTRLDNLARQPESRLPPNVNAHVRRMQSLNSLWMSESLYTAAYGTELNVYERIEGGCEACVLAAVGSDPDVLTDMMAAVYGRKRRSKPHGGWAAVHGRKGRSKPLGGSMHFWRACFKCLEGGEKLEGEARMLGREILSTRKQLQAERRMRSRENSPEEERMARVVDVPNSSVLQHENVHSHARTADWDVQEQSGASSTVYREPFISDSCRPKTEDSEEESSLGSIISYYFRQSIARQPAASPQQAENSSSAYEEDVVFDEENGFFYKVGPSAFPIPPASPAGIFSPITFTPQKMSSKAKDKQPEVLHEQAQSYGRPPKTPQPIKCLWEPVPGKREESFQDTSTPSLAQRRREQDRGEQRYTFYENPRTPPPPPTNFGLRQVVTQRVTQMDDFMTKSKQKTSRVI
ncbi:hypothetical protein ACMFMG_010129 [Clarireedia jacksonii]